MISVDRSCCSRATQLRSTQSQVVGAWPCKASGVVTIALTRTRASHRPRGLHAQTGGSGAGSCGNSMQAGRSGSSMGVARSDSGQRQPLLGQEQQQHGATPSSTRAPAPAPAPPPGSSVAADTVCAWSGATPSSTPAPAPAPSAAEASTSEERRFMAMSSLGVFAYFAVGIAFYTYVRPITASNGQPPTLIDVVYFIMVTLTTVGYGDFHPMRQDNVALLFTCAFILAGITLVSLFLSFLVGRIIDRQFQVINDVMETDDCPDARGRLGLTRRDREAMAAIGLVVFLMGLGVTVFTLAEGLSPVQALYVVCVSVTTVGFGDVVPLQQGTKLFATVWLAVSSLALAKCVSLVVEMNNEKKLKALRASLLQRDLDDHLFSRFDMDGDGKVTRYEFLVHQLLEGEYNVTKRDIDCMMRRFDELDHDKDQHITIEEAQRSSMGSTMASQDPEERI
ncbi:hypothetical protein FOA52_005677 [Chlamydomonas sp. UWO 241]|nr:hypothetical protein FOA52_005677 [Chlamydomonas sp. UWO 241]